ncbi:MAG TPA: serine/threonine protein kinase [Ramlibacter sp.]|nr:serine/threonine protein kinase [Ramlibacter sp.]
MTSTHPYDALTPDVVLDALAAVGLHGDGRLLALSSYENRVYQVQLEASFEGHGEVVAKFYRPARWSDAAILEEHAFAAELAAAEIPAVAPLAPRGGTLHHYGGFGFSVSPRRGGRAPELDDEEVLEWIGRFLARIHLVGATRPFQHRPLLDLQGFGREPREWLLASGLVPLDVEADWTRVCDAALQAVQEALGGPDGGYDRRFQLLRTHGDCHPGNILWTPDQGPHFVDLDDARTAPAVQDLWMLLSGERAQRQRQLGALLDGYEQMRDFDRRELALIEPLRTLRLIHYSAWLARRWDDPAFPAAFPWFGSSDYWKGQVQLLEEQLEQMAEPPLVA